MVDGLKSELGDIGALSLEDNAASGTIVDATFGVISTGSGTLDYGNSIQAGSAIASDGRVTVPFAISFAAAPIVVITPIESGTLGAASWVDNIGTGSFTFFGQSGLEHSWLAIGSGRV